MICIITNTNPTACVPWEIQEPNSECQTVYVRTFINPSAHSVCRLSLINTLQCSSFHCLHVLYDSVRLRWLIESFFQESPTGETSNIKHQTGKPFHGKWSAFIFFSFSFYDVNSSHKKLGWRHMMILIKPDLPDLSLYSRARMLSMLRSSIYGNPLVAMWRTWTERNQ